MAGPDGDSWIFHAMPGLPSSLPQDGEENFPWFFREMLFPGAEGRRRGSPPYSLKSISSGIIYPGCQVGGLLWDGFI